MMLLLMLLMLLLDHESFRLREAGQRLGTRLAPALLAELEDLEAHHPSCEVRVRCRALVEQELQRRLKAGTILPRGGRRLPKIDRIFEQWEGSDFDLCGSDRSDWRDYYRIEAAAAGWPRDLDRGATWRLLLSLHAMGHPARSCRELLEQVSHRGHHAPRDGGFCISIMTR